MCVCVCVYHSERVHSDNSRLPLLKEWQATGREKSQIMTIQYGDEFEFLLCLVELSNTVIMRNCWMFSLNICVNLLWKLTIVLFPLTVQENNGLGGLLVHYYASCDKRGVKPSESFESHVRGFLGGEQARKRHRYDRVGGGGHELL